MSGSRRKNRTDQSSARKPKIRHKRGAAKARLLNPKAAMNRTHLQERRTKKKRNRAARGIA